MSFIFYWHQDQHSPAPGVDVLRFNDSILFESPLLECVEIICSRIWERSRTFVVPANAVRVLCGVSLAGVVLVVILWQAPSGVVSKNNFELSAHLSDKLKYRAQ